MDPVGVAGGSGVNLVGWETGGDERGTTGTASDTNGMAGWDFWGLSRDLAGRGSREADKAGKSS